MRIIAGRFRGRNLQSPADLSIRPTSDRVRESIFNIIAAQIAPNLDGQHVLDLFAGTGAFGLEALSRGAAHATFVEMSAEGRGLIRGHIEDYGVGGIAKLLRRDATNLGPSGNAVPCNLVFADPPYDKKLGELALKNAHEFGWISSDALIVLEEKRGVEIGMGEQFHALDRRDYGATSVHFFRIA